MTSFSWHFFCCYFFFLGSLSFLLSINFLLLNFHNILYYAFLIHFILFIYILCVCVCAWFYWLIYPFSTFSLCLCSFSFTLFEHIVFFFKWPECCPQLALLHLHFKKYVCHVVDIIISPTGDVHCDTCHSKSMVQKLGFLHGSIITNDELLLLTIEGKWLEAIVHMIESNFFNLACPKEIQLLISIRIHGKFLIIEHIYPCWFSRKHPIIYPTSGNQFEGQRFNCSFDNYFWW